MAHAKSYVGQDRKLTISGFIRYTYPYLQDNTIFIAYDMIKGQGGPL
jgi:hypothetical protein